jgi:hypothetical protein
MEDKLMSEEELIQAKKARINELKNAIESIKSLGFQPPHDMVFELEQLENLVLVNYELIPTLTGLLENEFSKFKSEVNLLLRYSPEEGLDISFFSDRISNSRKSRTKRGEISIVFKNGEVISNAHGSDTLTDFIRQVGTNEVKKLNMKTGPSGGRDVIITTEELNGLSESVRYNCRYKSVGNDLHVHTCLTTERKCEIIKNIIEKLGIDAKVIINNENN